MALYKGATFVIFVFYDTRANTGAFSEITGFLLYKRRLWSRIITLTNKNND